jgi:cytochrome P450
MSEPTDLASWEPGCLEAEIAFTTILAGCPDLALAVDPVDLPWRRSRALRGLKRLPVTFTVPAR